MKKSPLPCFAALALGSLPASAATVLFADNFDRPGNTNLNATATGKSGTLGALNWIEVPGSPSPFGNVSIANISGPNSGMTISSGTATTLSGVPYVDHNFTGLTTMTVAFDFISASNSGGLRQLGFGIGNSKTTLDALTSSGAFGDVGISIDVATTVAPIGQTGVQISHGGVQQTYISRTITSEDTFSATFTFADMNVGTAINYEVFQKTGLVTTSLYTGTSAWSATNQNYIGIFNTHRQANSSTAVIDNFVVSIPEPRAALLGGLGLLALLCRRR